MDRIALETIAELVAREVEKYAPAGLNARNYAILDSQRQLFAAMSVAEKDITPDRVVPIVMARLEGDLVIIEADNTNKPLSEALIQAGIPAEQIVLAYSGATMPISASVKP
jgi:hypothetical protein